MAGASHYTLPRPKFDKPVKLLIVVAPYYKDIADELIAGAKAEIEAAGGTWDLVEVPGALEVPTAIGIAARMSNFDGYVALGCVIRGDTAHFDFVAGECARGLMHAGLETGVPVIFGVLTVENEAQAQERADPSRMNKGGEALEAAVEMAILARDSRE
jgi:6,7-dimethyl-8-ribityllumazine synthase